MNKKHFLRGIVSDAINQMLFQYFINYKLPGGSYIATTPVIAANWNAETVDQWTIPFGLGAGRIVSLGGKLLLNLKAGAYFNAVKPDYDADWTLQLQAVILLPTSIMKKK